MKIEQISVKDFVSEYTSLVTNIPGSPYSISYIENQIDISLYSAASKINSIPRLFRIFNNGNSYPVYELFDHFEKGMVLAHPFDAKLYDVHKHYEDGLGRLMQPIDDNLIWPLADISGHPTFDSFIRNGMRIKLAPHFFGTKAERIAWEVVSGTSLNLPDLMDISFQQILAFSQRENDPIKADFYSTIRYEIDQDFKWVAAFDLAKYRELVCAMLLVPGGVTWNADRIARNTSEEYKPYSLVLAAQAYAIKHVCYDLRKPLNLGFNFYANSSYKDVIPMTRVKATCLPVLPVNSSIQEIEYILWGNNIF